MIVGVGTDIIEIARFKAAMTRQGERLLERVFTPAERRYCEGKMNRVAHYAARFAAKEAVLKALGTGWSGGIRWTDVEVVHRHVGKVDVRLAGAAAKRSKALEAAGVHLSISHSDKYATAVAVIESR